MRELPKYKCHKLVWALKIKAILINDDGSAIITPHEDGYAPFPVTTEYMVKHSPRDGGYYVQYEDGYKSYSPPQAFESGYSPI